MVAVVKTVIDQVTAVMVDQFPGRPPCSASVGSSFIQMPP